MTNSELILGAAVALMGGGNIWNWLASRGKTRIDMIELAQTISREIIIGLKQERDELIVKIGALEATVSELVQHVENLESALREKGITPPPRPRARHRSGDN